VLEVPDNIDFPFAPVVAALLGTLAVLVWRIRESRRAVSTRSIVIPPLGMSTGFSMFIMPAFRVPWTWALTAFAFGAVVLAYPLLTSSRLTRVGDVIMMRRSRTFIAVILGLAALRFALRSYVGEFVSVPQTAGLFFVLAFGMIVRWRAWMLLEYRRLTRV
jgi:membrane protein CcdC involved in cytochrome C biogenesis